MTDAERAARLFDIKPQSPWQPIETAPKDGTPFLAFINEDWIEGMYFSDAGIRYLSDADAPPVGRLLPTHWMPLPEPPPS